MRLPARPKAIPGYGADVVLTHTILADCSCWWQGQYLDGATPENYDTVEDALRAAHRHLAGEKRDGCWHYWGVHVRHRHVLVRDVGPQA